MSVRDVDGGILIDVFRRKIERSYCVDLGVTVRPVPATCIIKYAKLYGVKYSVMLDYCWGLNIDDRLPRGFNKKISRIKLEIRTKIN